MVERHVANVNVAGSTPVSRSIKTDYWRCGFTHLRRARVVLRTYLFYMALWPSGLRRSSAKALFVGSNPTGASK